MDTKERARESDSPWQEQLDDLDAQIEQTIKAVSAAFGDAACFPFVNVRITASVVDDVFDDLRANHGDCGGTLIVLIDSGGGDIDAAYNLAMLFRRYGHESLSFVVPRYAKSAATLLACAGDKILMTPVAELGPLDPQITEYNPLERRLENFSPLHIESTLEMIRTEYEQGSEKLAKALMERLQFPLTLGSFKKTLEIGEQYLVNLLRTRMLRDASGVDPLEVARKLTTGYANHGFCINYTEAKSIGLQVDELEEHQLEVVWQLHRLNKRRQEVKDELEKERMQSQLKNLPADLLNKLLDDEQQGPARRTGKEHDEHRCA